MLKLIPLLSILAACTFGKKTEAPSDYVIVEMNHDAMKRIPNFSVGRFKKFLKEADKEEVRKEMYSWNFVQPISHILKFIVEEGSEFKCDELHDVLFCKVESNTGRFLMDFSIADKERSAFKDQLKNTDWESAIHICRVQVGLAITKDNKDFWDNVKTFQSGSKKQVYKHIDFTHFHGAIIALKGAQQHTHVANFLASISISKEGTEEYRKFVDPNCIKNGIITKRSEL